MDYVINRSVSPALIIGAEFVETIQNLRPKLRQVLHYVCTGKKLYQGIVGYDGCIEGQLDFEPMVRLSDDMLAFVACTSGTTGFPKGAVLIVGMALAANLNGEEARAMHQLKSELLKTLRDRATSLISRSIYSDGYKREMEFTQLKE